MTFIDRGAVPIDPNTGSPIGGRRPNRWRAKLVPAYFRNRNMGGQEALFHVETGSKESGRRIVTHEFPKKELPYAEDMGRRAMSFTVRGYVIAYPYKAERHGGVESREPLYQEDYTVPRDILMAQLDAEGPGILQLPNGHGGLTPILVVCERYRMTEEQRLGGYATFDMSFIELGVAPWRESADPRTALIASTSAVQDRVLANLHEIGRLGPNHPQAARIRRLFEETAGYL